VILVFSASGSMSQDNTKNNRIQRTQRKAKKNKVKDHLRTVKSSLNKKSVVDSKATSTVLTSVSNVENEMIELYFVNTEYHLADLFTKALGRDIIEFLTNKLGMRSFTPETLKKLTNEEDE
nr:ribonuclease H [Tanacetum cinerariifolium]